MYGLLLFIIYERKRYRLLQRGVGAEPLGWMDVASLVGYSSESTTGCVHTYMSQGLRQGFMNRYWVLSALMLSLI